MMRVFACALLALLILPPHAGLAQKPSRPTRTRPKPVFSPPAGPVADKPSTAPADDAARGAQEKGAKSDGIDALFERLRRWPARPARKAAVTLTGLGAKVKGRLLKGLGDDDWRIRSGCAFALGEMGERDALEPLKVAIADPSNRAGLGDLLLALTRIDPAQAPEVLLPFMKHSSARIRRYAMRAMPPDLPSRYLPDVLELQRHARGIVRAQALALLARITGAVERDEFFRALGDPEARAAAFAARHLGRVGTPAVRDRLLEMARSAPLRSATYAMLALVEAEDSSGLTIIPIEGKIRDRAQHMLRGRDTFYSGAAAAVIANLSLRTDDAILRKLADEYLMSILLHAVAGGVFYSDYASLEPFCFRKLALLSGVRLGKDAVAWRAWWSRNRDGFAARRDLRSLSSADRPKASVRLGREDLTGQFTQALFFGDTAALGRDPGEGTFVIDAGQFERLCRMLEQVAYFTSRGEVRDEGKVSGWVEVEIRVGPSRFARFHGGDGPGQLKPLYDLLESFKSELAWQRFLVDSDPGIRRAALERERAFFAKTQDRTLRRRRILDLAIGAYGDLRRDARRLAVAVFCQADRNWVRLHGSELAALLKKESRLNREAVAIIGLLSGETDRGLRDVILGVVASAPTAVGRKVLADYIDQQPVNVVVRLMNDERARVRAAAFASARRFKDHGEMVNLLIAGLEDYDPDVRNACVQSLAAMKDDRILALLEAVLAGDDEALKIRAIPALAEVGGEQVVSRLMEIYRAGGGAEKRAVVRSLAKAGGRRAVVALAGIVRESGPMELRREALDTLAGLGGTDVAARLEDILERTRDPKIKILVMGALPRVIDARAIPTLQRHLEDKDAGCARAAAIGLGRLGGRNALSHLHGLMGAIEGDAAAERAMELLTFHVESDPAPGGRHAGFGRWLKTFRELTRKEWFLLAAREAGLPLDSSEDWIAPDALEHSQRTTLISLMRTGNRPLRHHADKLLLRESGLQLRPLPSGASKTEATDRAGVFELWAARTR